MSWYMINMQRFDTYLLILGNLVILFDLSSFSFFEYSHSSNITHFINLYTFDPSSLFTSSLLLHFFFFCSSSSFFLLLLFFLTSHLSCLVYRSCRRICWHCCEKRSTELGPKFHTEITGQYSCIRGRSRTYTS